MGESNGTSCVTAVFSTMTARSAVSDSDTRAWSLGAPAPAASVRGSNAAQWPGARLLGTPGLMHEAKAAVTAALGAAVSCWPSGAAAFGIEVASADTTCTGALPRSGAGRG